MAGENPHMASSFESWLDDTGIREDVTTAAIKVVIARQKSLAPRFVAWMMELTKVIVRFNWRSARVRY
jgi:hypothetical protein